MEKTLNFIATYNTQLIKAGFGIVFLLLIIYVYRLFFMASTSSGPEASVNTDAIEQKLNQILETQKVKAAQAEDQSQINDQRSSAEADRLKLEVYNLKQQLAESEKKAAASAAAAPASADAGSPEQVEKIRSLESRLAEYEIIAEDIAELSQLRTENAKLKEQLGGAPATESVAATSEAEPKIDIEELVMPEVVEEKAAEPVQAAAAAPAPENAEEQAIQQALAEAEAAAAEAVAAEAAAMMQQTQVAETKPEPASPQDAADDLIASLAASTEQAAISEEDQKLLAEFEQTIIKKG